MKWLNALGLSGVSFGRDDLLRVGVLLGMCVAVGLLAVNYGASATQLELQVGDVAPRTIKAPRSFPYEDKAEWAIRQDAAKEAVLPAYVHRVDLAREQHLAVSTAFDDARAALTAELGDVELADDQEMPTVADLSRDQRLEIRALFQQLLGVNVVDSDIDVLMAGGFSSEARTLVQVLLKDAMAHVVVADRSVLPGDRGHMSVIEVSDGGTRERLLRNYEAIKVPDELRREIEMRRTVYKNDAAWVDVSARLAQAMVRPNFRANPTETEKRQAQAVLNVPMVDVWIKRGTVLFRDGEALTQEHIDRYGALQATSNRSLWLEITSVVFFVALLGFVLVDFGSSHLRGFSLALRDLLAVGALVVLTTAVARLTWGLSAPLAEQIGYGCEPSSIWFFVPVAGAAMLIRLLVGVHWALVASIIMATAAGLIFGLDALIVMFMLVSGVVGAGAVHATRERMSVMRAGLFTGTVNAAMALLIHFLSYYMGAGEVAEAFTARPLWGMTFAFAGGLVSAFVVLGLMPLFEAAGFVTDYRLMELANLNHPLMRKLMLRAPGSYHHSVVVGSLAEAACDAIGANALQARVSAYFHDIGKAVKPQYFVENQGLVGSRHKGLDPYTSAAIIISHVTDGARMARDHRLPKPILDNISMHHGTGLLQYFYAAAVEQAGGDVSLVDEGRFRYPGPMPDNKESGVVMLADKVEAATRTIKEPNEEKFRSMIHVIINSVMADGQFSQCPLTFQELYTITDTFVGVLIGIHHQRIEYPQTASISAGRADVPPAPRSKHEGIITLEIPSSAVSRDTSPIHADRTSDPDASRDYESVEHLPLRDGE